MDCRALKRLTQVVSAVAAIGLAVAAQAQRAPEDSTPPPTPGPSEQPPPSSLPPCPAGEEAPKAAPEALAPPPEAPPPPAPVAVAPVERHHNKIFAPEVVSLTTGAGAANYFGSSDVNDSSDPGAAWDARVTFGARSAIALEAGYMGGVNNIDLGGGIGHGQVFSNGVDGDLRLQLPTRVQPYVFGGVGYNHMEVRNQNLGGTPGVANTFVGNDDQVTVPAGGGLNVFVTRHIDLDARGTYRFIPNNGITEMGTNHLHQWIAQAHVGYVF
jgi:opacity protein-like surface antigen